MFNNGRFVNVLDRLGRVHTAFVYSEMVDGNGIEIISPVVDSQTGKVTMEYSARNRHGKEFVEIDEDVEILRTWANESQPNPEDTQPLDENTGGSNS